MILDETDSKPNCCMPAGPHGFSVRRKGDKIVFEENIGILVQDRCTRRFAQTKVPTGPRYLQATKLQLVTPVPSPNVTLQLSVSRSRTTYFSSLQPPAKAERHTTSRTCDPQSLNCPSRVILSSSSFLSETRLSQEKPVSSFFSPQSQDPQSWYPTR
ncbi:hypothetical protein L228DRAFT_95481 [Xylona heveae TC161]|uniref:Uncharacterized protein n=1 Tax=Xylona heveae (strain CBS 132557 / TC161) TaxID=1328760 RepID=A0A161TEL7_XYLHT|nr:hypothetical protein L228DRAFT_95481 [Xylona heveae TC161]KZF24387.1 hypothetical protein L228DRAFT_95481 [Xylona heveae TC161]